MRVPQPRWQRHLLRAASLAALAGGGPSAAVADSGVRPPPVQYVEVTREAGIDFRHVNGASGSKFMPEPMGAGAAFFDADGDGLLDLYIVNGAPLPGYAGETGGNALFGNRGDGTFADITAASGTGDRQYGMCAAVGDYDADSDLDLFVGNYGPNVLYRNAGGVFANVTDEAGVGDPGWGSHATFVDYDSDGDLDLYLANYMEFDPADNQVCMRGEYQAYCGPNTYPGQSGVLYRNDGGLPFTDATAEAGLETVAGRQLGAIFGDLDGDGDPDLFVANDKRPNFLFDNNGDGTFTERGIVAGVAYNEEGEAESAMGADLGDYDNDGRLDIFLATFQWLPNTLYRNEGNGFFADVTFEANLGIASVPFLGMTAAFLDYDNDGHLDCFVANGHLDENVADFDPATSYGQRNQLFHNEGDGTFSDASLTSGPGMQVARASHGAIFGDYDNDGDVDIFVSDTGSPQCTLLRNDGGNGNRFLTLELRGASANLEGLGARVRAVAGDLVQTREVRRGYGYMGSNDGRLHLGLGQQARVDSLVIRWPTGTVQTLTDLETNCFLRVAETDAQ